MSLIQKQGSWNTIISYLGAAIGVINLIFLYPFFFQTDEIGLIRILTSISLLYAQIASVGLNSIILRFWPHYKSQNSGFAFGVLMIASIGFILATLILFVFQPLIKNIYLESAPLFVDYYFWLIPLTAFVVIFNIAENFLRMLFSTVFSHFCKEVVLRVLTLAGILAVAFGPISFEQFMIWFLAIHALIAIFILIQLIRSGNVNFSPTWSFFEIRRLRTILTYGLVSLLTGATTFLIQMIDSVMLGAYLSLNDVGVYTVAFFMGSVIAMPARAVIRIALPMVTNAWKLNQTDRIQSIYRNTSFLQFSTGLGILSIILINLHDIFRFLPDAFAAGSLVVIWIGLGHLIDMTGGINSQILNTSRRYIADLYFNLVFVAFCIISNMVLIPLYGLLGAAIASFASYLMVNLIRTYYLWYTFKMHPFNRKYLWSALVIIASVMPWQVVEFGQFYPIVAIILRMAGAVISLLVVGYLAGLHQTIKESLAELKKSEIISP